MKVQRFNLSVLVSAILAVHFGFASVGFAAEKGDRSIAVFNEPVSVGAGDSKNISANFQIDSAHPELGRAWIEISLYTPPQGSSDNAGETKIIKKNVPGLKYNASTQEVVFDQGAGSAVVCAKLVKKHFLFLSSQSMESTGNCNLSANLEARAADDGFQVKTASYAVVMLRPDETRTTASKK